MWAITGLLRQLPVSNFTCIMLPGSSWSPQNFYMYCFFGLRSLHFITRNPSSLVQHLGRYVCRYPSQSYALRNVEAAKVGFTVQIESWRICDFHHEPFLFLQKDSAVQMSATCYVGRSYFFMTLGCMWWKRPAFLKLVRYVASKVGRGTSEHYSTWKPWSLTELQFWHTYYPRAFSIIHFSRNVNCNAGSIHAPRV